MIEIFCHKCRDRVTKTLGKTGEIVSHWEEGQNQKIQGGQVQLVWMMDRKKPRVIVADSRRR